MPFLKPVLLIVSIILMILSALMILPVILLPSGASSNKFAFMLAACITFVPAAIYFLVCRKPAKQLRLSQLYLITMACWVSVSLFGALPLIFSNKYITVTDAIFESVSGITTTGSTVLVNLDTMPRDILLWRSLLQWLGGSGIIGIAIVVLPFIGAGGMRLFKTEYYDRSDKMTPRLRGFANLLVLSYLTLTLLCCVLYVAGGMSWFDAINHAMATISTGGYSTYDASFGHFDSVFLQWTATTFMFLGSIPFVIYVRFMIKQKMTSFNDMQIKGLLKLLIISSFLLAVYLTVTFDWPFEKALTAAAFNITSIVSTTGFATADYQVWGSGVMVAFFFFTFVGGCAGSTSGGMKIFRFQLSLMFLREQVMQLLHPRAVLTRKYNNQLVDNDIISSAIAFTFIFFVSFAFIALALASLGLDFVTSLSGAATALCNVGPGLGSVIGPAGNFAALPDAAKWILCLGMILGRLEILSVIIIFTKRFWDG